LPDFTLYRLHETIRGRPVQDLDDYIDSDESTSDIYGPVDMGDFIAKLYVRVGRPHVPGWARFVLAGFQDAAEMPVAASVGAVVVLRLKPEGHTFAFTFGTTGRFLLRREAWQRSYGLKTALNLMYPAAAGTAVDESRLVAVDAKKRAGDTIRKRQQASKATTFEAFEIDKLRELVGGATGRPHDRSWGTRVTGTDAISFAADSDFAGLGKLCRLLSDVHDSDDYKDRFSWIDSIRPVNDPVLVQELQQHILRRLLDQDIDDLDLAPPEIIDWAQVVGFQYHFDVRKGITRPDLDLAIFLSQLAYFESDYANLEVEFFFRKAMRAVNADGHEVHRWSAWQCLTGEFEYAGKTYVIDEGEIFEVETDYLKDLNAEIELIPVHDTAQWPAAMPTTLEDTYNRDLEAALAPAVLMDKKTVKGRMQTTEVEVCDVLTKDRSLIHVKLHFGSRDLSHLFSQGFVSANLLLRDVLFRRAAHEKIKALGGGKEFYFFDVQSLPAHDFKVIYAIVAHWKGRKAKDALPFFSKVNLARTAEELRISGFNVAIACIDTGGPRPRKAKKGKSS
jgi:uncharacterized protein (TIGR04141 family)